MNDERRWVMHHLKKLNNYTIKESNRGRNQYDILKNKKNVGYIQIIVDEDERIEVEGMLEDIPFYYQVNEEKDYFYVEMKKYVIIYNMEAFKEDVFNNIKEAE